MAAPSLHLVESAGETQAEQRLLERVVAGRYRVIELVSRTGMGSVYRAWEHGLERHVAIKLLSPSRCRDAEDRGRFRREARILAGLAHPGIVPVLAIGERTEACWFSMPWLPGGTLAAALEPARRLGHEAARGILVQLADALAFVHANQVVHRDLKAENICFDASGRVVLADFGVATLRTSDHSRSEITKGMGTARYMPPEQLMGSPDSDARADLYALGVLGFRMVAGRFPFEGNDAQIAAQHLAGDIPPVAAYASDVPADLAAAIDRCLARRPDRRWKDAAQLRDALSARTTPRRGLRWLQRVATLL